MLVLSRREGEKIVFPEVGVSIEVLRVKGSTSRLGIEAPVGLTVLREELLAERGEAGKRPGFVSPEAVRRFVHMIRNRVNEATTALYLFRGQLDRGMADQAELTFAKLARAIDSLGESLNAERPDAARPPSPEAPAPRRRALLVEDDANESELLAGFLRLSGFDVATADDGCDALDYLSSHEQPDVVLLDMLMPRCDGPQTVEAIRRDPTFESLKVFAISGTPPATLGVATGPEGIDRWFQKPVNPEKLVREITRELTRQSHPSAAT